MKAIILALGISVFSLASQAAIKIQSATWGTVSASVKAAQFCDGKDVCSYKVSSKYITAPANAPSARFQIRWSCGTVGEIGVLTIAQNAEDQILSLECPIPSAALVKAPAGRGAAAAPVVKPVPLALARLPDATKWTQYLIQNQPVSLHAMIFDPAADAVESKIGSDCALAIRKFLRSGRNFRSQVMLTRYTQPLSKFEQPETRAGSFYHYTNASAVRDAVENHDLNPIFSFLRSRVIDDNENRWFWYVATDPLSSKSYGSIKVNVHFDPQSLVFIAGSSNDGGQTFTNPQVNADIQDELIRKDAGLSVCRDRADTPDYCTDSILTYLAAEASGIRLVAYYGVMNQMVNDPDFRRSQWLQVIGPWAVKSADVE